jgi:hypothetical protein
MCRDYTQREIQVDTDNRDRGICKHTDRLKDKLVWQQREEDVHVELLETVHRLELEPRMLTQQGCPSKIWVQLVAAFHAAHTGVRVMTVAVRGCVALVEGQDQTKPGRSKDQKRRRKPHTKNTHGTHSRQPRRRQATMHIQYAHTLLLLPPPPPPLLPPPRTPQHSTQRTMTHEDHLPVMLEPNVAVPETPVAAEHTPEGVHPRVLAEGEVGGVVHGTIEEDDHEPAASKQRYQRVGAHE